MHVKTTNIEDNVIVNKSLEMTLKCDNQAKEEIINVQEKIELKIHQ